MHSSDQEAPKPGVRIVEPLKGNQKSVIPREAIEQSREAEEQAVRPGDKRDPFAETQVSSRTPAVDSSEESLGG